MNGRRWERMDITKLALECLEPRRLMAIDLSVEYDAGQSPIPGAEVTHVIRVFNHGDEDASDVLIQSSLTNELENPQWRRELGTAKRLSNPATLREPDLKLFNGVIRPDRNFYFDRVKVVGDLNGDGIEDFLFRQQGRRRTDPKRVVASVVFGGLEESINAAIGRVSGRQNPKLGFDITSTGAIADHWMEFQAIGDVNNDGFDDLAFANRILFGGKDIAEQRVVNLEELKAGQGLWLPAALRVFGIGDANLDGIDDLAMEMIFGTSSLLWGGSHLSDAESLEPSALVENGLGADYFGVISHAANIGDFNGDGAGDIAIASLGGIKVFFASQDLQNRDLGFHVIDAGNSVQIGSDFGFNYFSLRGRDMFAGHLSAAGDVDGDGFDDLLISLDGGNCHSCTGYDRSNRDRFGGAVVVFGGAEVGFNGKFDHEVDRHATFRLATRYEGEQRPTALATDVNGDGLGDIQIKTDVMTHNVFGGDELVDIDFGFSGKWFDEYDYELHSGFNGENGFSQFGDITSVDINGDGILDELVQADDKAFSVFLGQPTEESVSVGAGDIAEVIDIPRDSSVIYTVVGKRRESEATITTSAISQTTSESNLRDNVVSDRTPVGIDITVDARPILSGREVSVEFAVASRLSDRPIDVSFSETLSQHLTDVRWTSTTNSFPAKLSVRDLSGELGDSFLGPRRLYGHGASAAADGYDETLFLGLGQRVGSIPDIDGDGFDEIFVTSQQTVRNGRRSDSTPNRQFNGKPTLPGQRVLGLPTALPDPQIPDERVPLGDFNSDGIQDALFGDPFANDSGGAVYVVFGGPQGIPELGLSEIDGINGLAILGDEPGQSLGYAVDIGDVNGDDRDDLVISEGCRDCWIDGESGSFFSRAATSPRVYVVFGSEALSSGVAPSLQDLDGSNGFVIELDGKPESASGGRRIDVASGFDFNGDGVDDIVIGDTGAGTAMPSGNQQRHGGLYLALGRKHAPNEVGTLASLSTTIPVQGEIIYELTGVVKFDESLQAHVNVHVDDESFVDLFPATNNVAFELNPAQPGDVDLDGDVDMNDFLVFANNFGQEEDVLFEDGDFDGDGRVSFLDFLVLARNFRMSRK